MQLREEFGGSLGPRRLRNPRELQSAAAAAKQALGHEHAVPPAPALPPLAHEAACAALVPVGATRSALMALVVRGKRGLGFLRACILVGAVSLGCVLGPR